ncbi:hypothetical protein DLJ53_07465 [Acuticoccus sediminis]|uniref:Anaphase-promoting complex subunit 4 WD40 domain-containing protein n=1 Tax=Acuticoccus sediminis TaxID=2184697 RepID=A0A8B2P584_9HYPH|nr:WD40 repeat domain-containing protein [Acuticoccus sediminis]RAI04272.1 hypothetical protein DLJ53_07465 [Acuticoccus sediminis]
MSTAVQDAPAAAPSLFAIASRIWDAGAPVEALTADRDGAAVAFELADGNVALAPARDPEPAATRIRIAGDSGQMSITPRAGRYAPLERAELGTHGTIAVCPSASGRGVVAIRSDGRLVRITPRGQVVTIPTGDLGRVGAIASHPAGPQIAVAAGGNVVVGPEDEPARGTVSPLPGDVAALAVSPDGRVAAATREAIHLLDAGRTMASFAATRAERLVFSPDGTYLAAALFDGGVALVRIADGRVATLANYPAPVRSLAFSRPASAFATSGAYRAAAWSLATPPFDGAADGALVTGRPGLVLVETVAAHPRRPLLAIGYADGIVTLAPIGSREEMVLCPTPGGAVTALGWAGAGDDLAIGRADGMAAIANLPPALFK